MKLEYIQVDPKKVKLLEDNPRWMTPEQFNLLTHNIMAEGDLLQDPFGCIWNFFKESDTVPVDKGGDTIWECLGGNHRIKAAIEGGMKKITMKVTRDPIDKEKRLAIALSLNAISGQDDSVLLAKMYEKIKNINLKEFSGLDDEILELLKNVQVESISPVTVSYQPLTIMFMPNEVQSIQAAFDDAKTILTSEKKFLVRMKEYDTFLDSLEEANAAWGVHNMATALLAILQVFQDNKGDLKKGWLDKEGEAVRPSNFIPLSLVINNNQIPARGGALLNKVIERMVTKKELNPKKKYDVFELLALYWLEKESKSETSKNGKSMSKKRQNRVSGENDGVAKS